MAINTKRIKAFFTYCWQKKRIRAFLIGLGLIFANLLVYFLFPGNAYRIEKYGDTCRKQAIERTTNYNSDVFVKQAEALFEYWYGTRYDYNGTTTQPRKGKIACGYFVTTLLEDLGWNLNRRALAIIASEAMMQNLVSENYIQRFSNSKSIEKVLQALGGEGKDLYILGLDTHTGFLLKDGDKAWFIHASGRYPWAVVKEKATKSGAILDSKYKVTACLTCNKAFFSR